MKINELTLVEAFESGKPFKRKNMKNYFKDIVDGTLVGNSETYLIQDNDILAKDWCIEENVRRFIYNEKKAYIGSFDRLLINKDEIILVEEKPGNKMLSKEDILTALTENLIITIAEINDVLESLGFSDEKE